MSYTAKEIGLVVQRLDGALRNTLVRKVISPHRGNRICLELRGPGVNYYLQLCVAGLFCSIGRLECKPKAAEIPTSFVMLLRKLNTNCVLSKVQQLNDDRVVAITFERKREKHTLLCELSGRHGNLFLLDRSDVILGSYYPNRSKKRFLVAGQKYQLPLHPPSTSNQMVRADDGPLFDVELLRLYREKENVYSIEQKRAEANRAVKSLLKKTTTLVKNLEADQENALRAEKMKSDAYILQANLHALKRGDNQFNGFDFEGKPVSFGLDSKKSAVENMQSMFEKARRLLRATGQIEDRLLAAMEKLEQFERLKQRVVTADEDELDGILSALSKLNELAVLRAKKRRVDPPKLPYKQFAIFGAHTARVGKSAKDNDALTLRHGKPNDLWLHVRGIPGSHVVVPLGRGEEPSQEVLIDAAHLAVHFSSARGDHHVEVTYTKRKYVQKPKGAAPGSVRLLKEKTFILKCSEERLQSLLSSNK